MYINKYSKAVPLGWQPSCIIYRDGQDFYKMLVLGNVFKDEGIN